jgi:hypothetical protein
MVMLESKRCSSLTKQQWAAAAKLVHALRHAIWLQGHKLCESLADESALALAAAAAAAGTAVRTPMTLHFSSEIPRGRALTRPGSITWGAGDGSVDLKTLRMCSK